MATCCGSASISYYSCDGGGGACGDCNDNNWGFAWAAHGGASVPACDCCGSGCICNNNGCTDLTCACSMGAITCGDGLFFSWGSSRCYTYFEGLRVDSGPDCYLDRVADFSPALFMKFAPLSQGVLTDVVVTTNGGCCS